MSIVDWCDIDGKDMEACEKLLHADACEIRSVRILLCRYDHPFGGVFTILRIADALLGYGFRVSVVVYDDPNFDFSPTLKVVQPYLPRLTKDVFFTYRGDWGALPPADAAMATFWASAYHLLKMPDVKKKVLLIQDMEPLFYPAGTEYALAENTLRMPFHRLYNTIGLMEYVERNYPCQGRSEYFTPACDERYAFCPQPLAPPYRLFLYARPSAHRNAAELAAAFAQRLLTRFGNKIEITAAGEQADRAAKKLFGKGVQFSGIVPYERLPEFYGSFHFGLALMLTKHPSYLPFELMACGTAVIANKNEANTWLLKDGENALLAHAAVTPLAQAFERGLDPYVYDALLQNGLHTVRATSWQTEMERVCGFFRTL